MVLLRKADLAGWQTRREARHEEGSDGLGSDGLDGKRKMEEMVVQRLDSCRCCGRWDRTCLESPSVSTPVRQVRAGIFEVLR